MVGGIDHFLQRYPRVRPPLCLRTFRKQKRGYTKYEHTSAPCGSFHCRCSSKAKVRETTQGLEEEGPVASKCVAKRHLRRCGDKPLVVENTLLFHIC
jgi:hypothetical protein